MIYHGRLAIQTHENAGLCLFIAYAMRHALRTLRFSGESHDYRTILQVLCDFGLYTINPLIQFFGIPDGRRWQRNMYCLWFK